MVVLRDLDKMKKKSFIIFEFYYDYHLEKQKKTQKKNDY